MECYDMAVKYYKKKTNNATEVAVSNKIFIPKPKYMELQLFSPRNGNSNLYCMS